MKKKLIITGIILVIIDIAVILSSWHGQSTVLAQQGQPDQVIDELENYLPIIVKNADNSDCSAIQDAIDNLPSTGGQVLVSTGTFTCSTAIVIAKNNVSLRGQGKATILYLADGSNSPVLVIGDTTTPAAPYVNIQVSDLAIDGNKDGQTLECWGGSCDTGGLTVIRNNGITIRGASDVLVERVSITRSRSGGLVSEKGCRRLIVQDLTSSENYFDGIALYETEDSIFTNLHLHHNPFAGMSLDINFNNNIVSDAVMTDNGKQGIFMRDSRDNQFDAIAIRNSGEQGLFLAQVDSDTNKPAAGNTFTNMVVSNSAQAGMRVNNDSCVNNLVVGAQFISNVGGCISESTTGLVEDFGVICR